MTKKESEQNKKTPIEHYTKYEEARMIGSRALQIAMGAPPLVKFTEKELEDIGYNPVGIAKKEFEKGVLPITIKRPMPNPPEKEK